jgi:DNA topoisomerase-1
MNLMIVESPTKAKKIQEYLGNEWTVIATAGHIRDLPKKDLGIDIKNGFLPTYEVYEDKTHLISKLKKAALNADEIYLASDPDREGEAIAWHTLKALSLRNAKRITFTEINKKAILAAVKNHRKIDINFVRAQEARRVLDRLFGYIISPILCSQSNLKLSAGRVQSPALKIIYMRDIEV